MLSLIAAAATVSAGTPSKMQAVVAHSQTKDFSSLKIETIETPTILPNQVLIRAIGSSVNPVDWKIIEYSGFGITYPVTLGFDIAGHVVEVGSNCTRLKVGDTVWADKGADMGSYAEYVAANESIVGLAPQNLPLNQVAVLPLVSLTAYEALVTYGKAPWASTANKTVLISAGQGGTGIAGIQLAKYWGATKVITAASTANVGLMKKLGADVVVDFTKENIWDVVPDDSVDILFENLGLSGTADLGLNKVRAGGVYTTIAGSLPDKTKEGVKIASFMTDSSDYHFLDALKDAVENEGLLPIIKKKYPLYQVGQAFTLQSTTNIVGKIEISIG